jgi:hypothetical protein
LEGRAPHAREGMPWFHPGMPRLGHRPLAFSSLVMPYPGFASGRTTRARRPRPSEKTTSRVISGLSPVGDRRCNWPPLGGAGSARPHGNALAPPGPHPARPSVLGSPSEGRAPHARNVGIAPYRCISPLKPLVPLVGVPVSRRGGLCTPVVRPFAPPGHLPARRSGLGSPPWRGGLRTPVMTH